MFPNQQKLIKFGSTFHSKLQYLFGLNIETLTTLYKDSSTRQISQSHKNINLKIIEITKA